MATKKALVIYSGKIKEIAASDTLAGTGGAVSVTTVEKDLGSDAMYSGHFDITGLSGLVTDKQVVVTQAVAPYTGKGALSDESEMDSIVARGIVTSATVIRVQWTSATAVRGNFKFNYFIQS